MVGYTLLVLLVILVKVTCVQRIALSRYQFLTIRGVVGSGDGDVTVNFSAGASCFGK